MPEKQDLINHRLTATACKNYTDKEIKASEERILSIVARNNVDFIDHINEPTYRFTAPLNSKLLMLQSIAGNSVKYAPTTASDSTTAYQKTIPSYSPSIDRASASMNILGGMSYKVNQLVTNADFVKNANAITITNVNHKLTITGTTTASEPFNIWLSSDVLGLKINHKYLFIPTNNDDRLRFLGQTYTSDNMFIANKITSNNGIFTDTTNDNYKLQIYFYCIVGITYNDECYLQLFDLTADFGSGNEPASVSDCATEYAKRGVDIYSYTPQQSAIRDTAPTSVVSKDSNDTTIDTLTIDSNIQALDGYGWGIDDTCYNYIDFNAKKFIKKVARVDLRTITWGLGGDGDSVFWYTTINDYKFIPTNPNTLCEKYEHNEISGSNTLLGYSIYSPNLFRIRNGSTVNMPTGYFYYELTTPVETDISEYLDGNSIEIEPNGTLSFESTYNTYVPSNVSYNGVIKHALATAVKQEGANRFNINEVYSDTTKFTINGDIVTGIAPYVFTPTYSKRNFTQDEIGKTFKFRVLFTSNCSGSNLRVVKRENGVTSDGNLVNSFPNYSTITVTPTSVNDYIGINFSTANSIQISEVMLNEGNTALSYRPYKTPITRLLPNSEAKYSWGITTGVRNTRVFCDDECNPVNEGQLDVNNVDLGIPNWLISNNLFATNLNTLRGYPFISAMYQFAGDINIGNVQNMEGITRNGDIYLRNDSYSTLEAFKTAMNGEILWYQKNATSTETLDDFDYFFDCEEGDTFTLVNTEQLQCYATYSFLIKEAKSNE